MIRLLLLLIFIGFSAQADDCEHTKTSFNCVKYVKNYDGDTITFKIPNTHPLIGDNIAVRVNGVDTPELRTSNDCEKAAGRTAKRLVQNLLKRGKRINLNNVKKDKYFRIIADVDVDGKDIKKVLLDNKLAYAYFGGTKKKVDWCSTNRKTANQEQK